MSKKLKALPFLMFVFIAFAQAQVEAPVEIMWGEEYKEPRNSALAEFVGEDEEGFYALRLGTGSGIFTKEGKIIVERYNKKMRLVKSNEIKLRYKKKDLNFEELRLINGKLVLFSSYQNRKKKTHYLFAQTLGKKTLQPKNDLRVIEEIPIRSQFQEGTFDIEFSKDSSAVLIFSQLPYQSRASEKYKIQVLNKDLETAWTKDIELPYTDEKFSIENYRISNTGDVYVLGIIYNDTYRRRRQGKPNYKYTLLTYSQNDNLQPEYEISLGDKFITDLTFRIQRNGDPVCAGFFSDRSSYTVRGTYFFKINSDTGEIYDSNSKEFEFDFLTELMSERGKKRAARAEEEGDEKRQAELYEYKLDELIIRSDGGAVLIAEQFYIQTLNNSYRDLSTGAWRYRSENRYYYNDIIVVNINPDGSVAWATHVPKRQVTVNDGGYFSSYVMAVTGKAIYLVFNDNGKNFNRDEDDKIYSYNGSRSVVTLAEIRPDGSVLKYPLFSNREEGIITRPKVCKQTGRYEMVIYGERSRSYKFARVRL